jgi:NADPH:quinone reductase-like Zn-dependent oxidoreductase
MKAARLHAYETAPVVEDVATPDVGPDEVLVRIAASALNPLDVKLQKGVIHDFFPLDFPYTIGTDLAGTIDRLGSNVAGWSEGDQVVARLDPTKGGALAEFAAVPASYLVKAPGSLRIAQAAGIATTGGTAWQALFEVADLKPGQMVLVHAGAGGVGSFAIQFARSAGARVIATASGDGIAIARRLGADRVIDHHTQDFGSMLSDVDLVLDTIGGDTQQRSFAVLRAGGMLLSTVSPPDEALAKAHNVTGAFFPHASDAVRLAKVADEVDAGAELLIDRTLPLDAVEEAFTRQASGRAQGKILLAP